MLTLTREAGQKIVIGEDIVITVVSISDNGRVRLGIDAPRQIRIDRSEVLDRIRSENVEAGGTETDSNAWAVYAAQKANRRASGGSDVSGTGDPGADADGPDAADPAPTDPA